jgi:prephenate dehydrogenase
VVGLDYDEQTLAMAKMEGIETYCFNTQGMADETAIPDILSNTGIIFLCVPVSFISSTVRVIAKHIPRGTIITDTGSVKKSVVRDVEAALPDGVSFVGGHPMAGSERSGFRWAREDMFYRAPYILTPTPETDAETLWTMVKLVRDLGAKPIIMSPEEHDRVAAAMSHLPQVISTTLVNAVAKVHPEGSVMDHAGGGWRDTTRIAGSNAVMWKDILISNKDQILPLISAFKEQLSVLETAIKTSDEVVIKERFQNAKAYKK